MELTPLAPTSSYATESNPNISFQNGHFIHLTTDGLRASALLLLQLKHRESMYYTSEL